jgi:dephospho-CoA kinase
VKVLGLTGGVGMGKSASAQLLRTRGVPVVDTDDLARQVVAPGQVALTEIQAAFGQEMVGPDGQLRREVMAQRVFADPDARKRLEDILHPRIRALWRTHVDAWRGDGRPLAVVVIPLLFETRAEAELDATVCVACTAATQHQRLRARGWTPKETEQRLRAQWPIEVKVSQANYVIWTEGSLDVHAGQLDRVLRSVQEGVGTR